MRRHDKSRIIREANERLEKNYLKSKGLLKEDKKPEIKKLSDKELNVISKILEGDILGEGEEILNEGSFSDIRKKFNSALKKGAMTFGVLAAVLGSPNMAQAQKAQLKDDVTNSTWFLDSQKDFNNEKMGYSALVGDYVDNPDFDQDVYNKSKEDRNYNPVTLEKWVNNLGQDSTVWKQYQDKEWKRGVDGVGKSTYSNPTVSKTVVNKDVKPWAGEDWAQLTKKGNIGNYLWSKDKTKSITPEVHKELKKLDKGKKVDYKDWKSTQAKQYKDAGMSGSDFYTVDLQNIQSPGQ